MDERAIKRLLVIVGISLIAIVLFKTMMTRTIVNLNKVAAEKNQSTAAASVPPASDTAIVIESPAASSAADIATLEPSAASGVAEREETAK